MIQTRHMVGVSNKAVAGIIGQLGGFGLDMRAFNAERIHRGKIEVTQDLEHQDGSCALAIWGMFQ